MKRKHIILITIVVILVVLSILTSLLKSVSGTVVDAETGKPIEGAVVLVEWTRRVGIGDYHTVSVRIAETVADKEGKFTAFGPLHPFVDPPNVTVYKRGYVAWNSKITFPDYKVRTDFKWRNGYEFKLQNFKPVFTHDAHVTFILRSYSFGLGANSKFQEAWQWETLLSLDETKKKSK